MRVFIIKKTFVFALILSIISCKESNDVDSVDNLIGEYCGEKIEKIGSMPYDIEIGKYDETHFIINNFVGTGVDVLGTISGPKINIPKQELKDPLENIMTVSGSGYYDALNKSLVIQYLINSNKGTIKLHKSDIYGILGNYSSDSCSITIQQDSINHNYNASIHYEDTDTEFLLDRLALNMQNCELYIEEQKVLEKIHNTEMKVKGTIRQSGNRIDIYLEFPAEDMYHISWVFQFSANKKND
jgi:hypothetical protein